MKLFVRIVSGFLAFFVLCVGILWSALQISWVQDVVAKEAARMVGPEVHFQRVGISLWPGLGISLAGVRVVGKDSEDGREVFKAEDVEFILHWAALWTGEVELGAIAFSDATLTVRGSSGGDLLLPSLFGRRGSTEKESSRGQGRLPAIEGREILFRFVDVSTDGSHREILLTDLSIDMESSEPGEDAIFKARGVWGAGPVILHGRIHRKASERSVLGGAIEIDVKGTGLSAQSLLPWLLPGPDLTEVQGVLDLRARIDGEALEKMGGTVHFQLRPGAIFEWRGLQVKAPLDFEFVFKLGESGFSIPSGNLSASSVRWQKLRAQNLSIPVEYQAGELQISRAKLLLYEGDVKCDGSLRFGSEITYQGEIHAENVSVKAMLTDLTETATEVGFDTMQTAFEFSGSFRDGEDAARGVQGRGNMRFEGGAVSAASVVGAVGGKLIALIPSALRPSGGGKLAGTTAIEYLSQNVFLKDGSFEVSNLRFMTEDYLLKGQGSIGLGGDLNLTTEIRFSAAGMQKLLIATAIPLPKTGVGILPGFPLRVTGTVADPVFLPEIQKIPVVALQVLFSPIKGASKIFLGGIQKAGSRLTNWMKPAP